MLLFLFKYLDEADKEASKNIKIKDIIGISQKCKNILENANIITLYDLICFSEYHDVNELEGVGEKILSEIKGIIERYKEKTLEYKVYEDDRIVIKDLYKDNRYNLFVKYCTDNNIIYVDQLDNFDFKSLINVHGLGEGKIKNIIEIYELNGSHGNVSFFNSINEELKDLDISFLGFFDIKDDVIERLRRNGFTKISFLENIKRRQLFLCMDRKQIDDFIKLELDLKLDLKQLLKQLLDNYASLSDEKEKRIYDIVLKRSEGLTLVEISEQYNITRQRVFSIEEKLISKIGYIMNPLSTKLIEKGQITLSDITIFDNDEYNKIIKYWFERNFDYIEKEKIFVKKYKG